MTTSSLHIHVRRSRGSPWLVAVTGLVAAVIGLRTWALVGHDTNGSEGLASGAVATMLEKRIAAMNRGDGKAAAAFYSKDAVLQEEDIGLVTVGRDQIGARLHALADAGLRVEAVRAPVQMGRFVGEPVRFDQLQGPGTGKPSSSSSSTRPARSLTSG